MKSIIYDNEGDNILYRYFIWLRANRSIKSIFEAVPGGRDMGAFHRERNSGILSRLEGPWRRAVNNNRKIENDRNQRLAESAGRICAIVSRAAESCGRVLWAGRGKAVAPKYENQYDTILKFGRIEAKVILCCSSPGSKLNRKRGLFWMCRKLARALTKTQYVMPS